MYSAILYIAVTLFSASVYASPLASTNLSACRELPGDPHWPSHVDWSKFNASLKGLLIATKPLPTVCHYPTFDEQSCEALRSTWSLAETFQSSPASVMLPLFQNRDCDPFTNASQPCTVGNMVAYSVNITSPSDVVKTLQFAKDRNLRIVIKNTGHDFLGKSSGKGGLEIWTHNLKSINFFKYSSATYKGPAVKLGAGVQAFEAYEAANAAGFKVVGGDCTTVGLVGGYAQGAGHGPLSTAYGLAADQVLEWEVVTASGQHLFVSPSSPYSDLYWAITGGGAGTFAVVISATFKVFPDSVTGGAGLTFSADGTSEGTFWEMVETWQAYAPKLVDEGAQVVSVLSKGLFEVKALTFVGKSGDQVQKLIRPMLDKITRLNLTHTLDVRTSPTYFEHLSHYFGPFPYGQYGVNDLVGSRLIPRSVVETNGKKLTEALRNITEHGFAIDILAQNVSHAKVGNLASSNAVLPAWRDSIYHMNVATTWDYYQPWAQNVANQTLITSTIVPYLEDLTPGSGTYLNEADVNLATWREDFYGKNWNKLTTIKQRYDPEGLLYAYKAIGSDKWKTTEDGRLCRTTSTT